MYPIYVAGSRMIQSFWKQYRLCRTRELTRPLGVLHAIKHSLHTAIHR